MKRKYKYVFIDENYVVIKPQGSKFSVIILVSENINILNIRRKFIIRHGNAFFFNQLIIKCCKLPLKLQNTCKHRKEPHYACLGEVIYPHLRPQSLSLL